MAAKFEKVSEGKYQLDVQGYVCPHPEIYTKKALEKLQAGDARARVRQPLLGRVDQRDVRVAGRRDRRAGASSLVIRVTDEGGGFEPSGVADPLAPENLLKSSGRGIFFMRSFMDDVAIARQPDGGMEVRMVKKLGASSDEPSA